MAIEGRQGSRTLRRGTRRGFEDGGSVFDDGAGLGAMAGDGGGDPATVVPGGIGDLHNALVGTPADAVDADGSVGLGFFSADPLNRTPPAPGGIGDLYGAGSGDVASGVTGDGSDAITSFLNDHVARFSSDTLLPAISDSLGQGSAPDGSSDATSPSVGSDQGDVSPASIDSSAPEQVAANPFSPDVQSKPGPANNNPANLKDDGSPWQGKIGVLPNHLVQFDSLQNGLRAAALNLLNQRCLHRMDTVETIIRKYAKTRRDPQKYINSIHTWMGTAPEQRLDLRDRDQLHSLLHAVLLEESSIGSDTDPGYDSAMLDQAISDAYGQSRHDHPECWRGM
jgi:hypothetical protein